MKRSRRRHSDEAWNRGFAGLCAYKKREGHCSVPRCHKEDGYRLGQWVAVQRYEQDDLLRSRKAQLDKLGFVWNQLDWWWEEAFAALKMFKVREGHCYVPAKQIEGTLHLGYWVTVQRRFRNKMNRDRRQRLDKIGFVWNGRSTKAIKHFREPRLSHARKTVRPGHCALA